MTQTYSWQHRQQKTKARRRLWIVFAALVVSLFVSGCVQSDLQVNFNGQSGGEIVQQIKVADQLTALNGSTAQDWMKQIERQARQLQGRAKRLSDQEIRVTVPFGSGTDLEHKLNQIVDAAAIRVPSQANAASSAQAMPLIKSHFKVKEQNFLLLLRSRLIYDLDLRSLGIQAGSSSSPLNPNSLVELKFGLNTPWGARSVNSTVSASASTQAQGKQMVWLLQPGQLNHIEAVFWYPSPIGLGTIAIVLLVAAGLVLKYGKSVLLGTAPPTLSAPQEQA